MGLILGAIGLSVTLGKLVWSASGQAGAIQRNATTIEKHEVDIDQNTRHRIEGDIKHEVIMDRLDKIDKTQVRILEAVTSVR